MNCVLSIYYAEYELSYKYMITNDRCDAENGVWVWGTIQSCRVVSSRSVLRHNSKSSRGTMMTKQQTHGLEKSTVGDNKIYIIFWKPFLSLHVPLVTFGTAIDHRRNIIVRISIVIPQELIMHTFDNMIQRMGKVKEQST
jgi:hypothetical protein